MRFKKIGAALLACAMCFGVFSTTAFAYVDESVATEEPAVEEKVPETEPRKYMPLHTDDPILRMVIVIGCPIIEINRTLRRLTLAGRKT